MEKLQKSIRRFNQNFLFLKNMDEKERYYPSLKRDIQTFGLCGHAANLFQDHLRREYKVKAEYIGLYHIPYQWELSNRKIIDDWTKNTGYIDSIPFIGRLGTKRHTHVLLEISCGNYKITADPTIGIIYEYGKEDLLRGIGIRKTIEANIDFLKRSIHRDHFNYYYLTQRFWESVYYLNYNNMLGDDITQFGEYDKYGDNLCW